jgi:hypothetical protein
VFKGLVFPEVAARGLVKAAAESNAPSFPAAAVCARDKAVAESNAPE